MNTTDIPIKSERELKTPVRGHLERVVRALASCVDAAPDWLKAIFIVVVGIDLLLAILNKLLDIILWLMGAP